MNAEIRSNAGQIILSTDGILSVSEALKLRGHLETTLYRKGGKTQVVFVHEGKLPLGETSFRAWEMLLGSLKHPFVKSACFIFQAENTPYRFFAKDLAQRAGVSAILRERLELLKEDVLRV